MFYIFGLIVCLLLMIFLALNLLSLLTLRLRPDLLVSENERLSLQFRARYKSELRPYVAEWFDVSEKEWPAALDEIDARISTINEYEDYTGFRPPAWAGKYVNISGHGFRSVGEDAQGPWPIESSNFNIFFFGGSTTLNVGPDWTSVPRYLQDALNERGIGDRPVRAYNFGRGAYHSTQERILFQQLLVQGAVPDQAVFFDGVNEYYFMDGQTAVAGFFTQALAGVMRESKEARESRLLAKPKWQRGSEFLWSLPFFKLLEIYGEGIAKMSGKVEDAPYRPLPVEPERLMPATERYLENKRQIEAICSDYGILPVFVWQPSPAYKYDLNHHVALNHHYGLGGHERSGVGYGLIKERLDRQPLGHNFVWLADIQEYEQRPLYLDNMHYTSAFSRVIANHIAEAMVVRGLVKGLVSAG
jgi:hypothetical protein